MKLDLENKKVLITGASGGIGQELSKKFAENGCKIIFTSSSAEKLDNLSKTFGNSYYYYTMTSTKKTTTHNAKK